MWGVSSSFCGEFEPRFTATSRSCWGFYYFRLLLFVRRHSRSTVGVIADLLFELTQNIATRNLLHLKGTNKGKRTRTWNGRRGVSAKRISLLEVELFICSELCSTLLCVGIPNCVEEEK